MPILVDATAQERKRLVELFPIAQIRENWPEIKGSKEEICFSIAETNDQHRITAFVDGTAVCCKQHVYIFDIEEYRFPQTIIDGERLVATADYALYVVRATYSVVLKDPLEETEISFLWPIHLSVQGKHLIVQFVVLEKNLASYFERPCYTGQRSVDEDSVLKNIGADNLTKSDLHKGIKALWAVGFMDTSRTRYKRPKSLDSVTMDEGLGIRENNPELYETLQETPLLNTLFIVEDQECGVGAFLVDCTNGYVAFPQYSARERGTDFVIQEILKNNN